MTKKLSVFIVDLTRFLYVVSSTVLYLVGDDLGWNHIKVFTSIIPDLRDV